MPKKPAYEELERRVQELEKAASEHQLAEKERLMILEVLELIDETEDLQDLLREILLRFKKWSGCEAVGIRLKDGPDFPYFVTAGFPEKFVEMERHLCSYEEDGSVKCDADGNPLLECMCGNIIGERFDPAKSFFTADGSFWSNCTTELLATTTDTDRQARTRNRCNSAGYESVALIPLRSAGETFGLVQLNDHQKGRFSPELIAMYRRVADYVAGFLAKRQAREALRKSETHLRTLLDTLPDLVWLKDPDGVFLACNPRFERLFGAGEAEIVGKTDYDFVDKELADYFRENDKAAMAAGKPCKNEEEVTFADDGHKELLETIKTPMYDAEGRLSGVLGIARDITQRKQEEEVRQYQERLLQEMGSIAKIGGWDFNPATRRGTWTEEVARIHDLDPGSETNLELGLSFYHGESRTKVENAIKAAIELGEPYDLELELISAKGTHKWVRTIGRPKIENGNVVQVRGSLQDITASRLAEQRIEHLNRVLKAIRDINQLIVHERDPAVLIGEGCRLLVDNRGYTSALIVRTDEHEKPVSWASAGLASSAALLDSVFERGELPPCWDRVRHEKEAVLIDDRHGFCGICPVSERCGETHSLGIRLNHGETDYGYVVVALGHNQGTDDEERTLFTEMAGDLAFALHVLQSEGKRKSLEARLIQAQKMESVGRLAGGVAHDYNNMLSIITGYTEMALEKADPDSPLHADLNEVLAAATRSTDITRQLLAFARKQTIAPKVLDLNDTVESTLKMLRRLIGEDIDLVWLPGTELRPIKIDPSQIDQILANLCVNARDAISGVGKIIIETSNVSLDAAYCADHAGFVPGDYVTLAVSDDGSGMPPGVLEKIFEPFFTTKGLGKGTGLGLATVYGIVKQNNGFINVYSEPEKGTTIRVYLSRHTGPASAEQRESAGEIPASRGETILLVEDDISILKLGNTVLERLGYTVLTASTPGEAVALAKEYVDKIDLLITDVVMPDMNGRKLADQLQDLDPDLKILFMSGYTSNVIAHRGILEEGVRFMPKPFSKRDLAVKVREALDNGKT